LLAGLSLEGENLRETRQFCKALCRERNAWDIARRARGMFGAHLNRRDADRLLRRQLAELAAGGEP